jgi:vesicle-associated membrane protein 7
MHTYNTAPPSDELARAQNELNQVKDVMVQNVEQILSRGERIDLLVNKTDAMAGQATAFRRGARTVRQQMWWKNTKILILSVFVGLVRRIIFSVEDSTETDEPISSSYICLSHKPAAYA